MVPKKVQLMSVDSPTCPAIVEATTVLKSGKTAGVKDLYFKSKVCNMDFKIQSKVQLAKYKKSFDNQMIARFGAPAGNNDFLVTMNGIYEKALSDSTKNNANEGNANNEEKEEEDEEDDSNDKE
jgi:hypothetical protein